MQDNTWTVRVLAAGAGTVRVTMRRQQLVLGRPLDVDLTSTESSALECGLGALGAEVVGGLQAFAKRRRLVLDEIEATVTGTVENSVSYWEVIGEDAPPRLCAVHVKVFVASPEGEATIRELFDAVMARLPLAAVFRRASDLSMDLVINP